MDLIAIKSYIALNKTLNDRHELLGYLKAQILNNFLLNLKEVTDKEIEEFVKLKLSKQNETQKT